MVVAASCADPSALIGWRLQLRNGQQQCGTCVGLQQAGRVGARHATQHVLQLDSGEEVVASLRRKDTHSAATHTSFVVLGKAERRPTKCGYLVSSTCGGGGGGGGESGGSGGGGMRASDDGSKRQRKERFFVLDGLDAKLYWWRSEKSFRSRAASRGFFELTPRAHASVELRTDRDGDGVLSLRSAATLLELELRTDNPDLARAWHAAVVVTLAGKSHEHFVRALAVSDEAAAAGGANAQGRAGTCLLCREHFLTFSDEPLCPPCRARPPDHVSAEVRWKGSGSNRGRSDSITSMSSAASAEASDASHLTDDDGDYLAAAAAAAAAEHADAPVLGRAGSLKDLGARAGQHIQSLKDRRARDMMSRGQRKARQKMSRRVEEAGKRAEAEARRLEASSVAIAAAAAAAAAAELKGGAASRAAEGGGEGGEGGEEWCKEWLPRTLKRQGGTRNSVDLGSPELQTRSLGGLVGDAASQQPPTGGGRAAGQRSNSWQLKTMLGKMIPRVSSKRKKAKAQRKAAAAGEAGVLSDDSIDGGTTEGGTTEDEGYLSPPEEQQAEAGLMREMLGGGRHPTSRGKQREQQGLRRDWTLPPTRNNGRQGGTRDSVDLGKPELLTRSLPVQTRSLGEHLSPQSTIRKNTKRRVGRQSSGFSLGGVAAAASNVAAAASNVAAAANSGRKSAEQWRQYYAAQAAQATAAAVSAAAAAVPHWRKAHAANFSSRTAGGAPKMTASQEAIVREMMGGKL